MRLRVATKVLVTKVLVMLGTYERRRGRIPRKDGQLLWIHDRHRGSTLRRAQRRYWKAINIRRDPGMSRRLPAE